MLRCSVSDARTLGHSDAQSLGHSVTQMLSHLDTQLLRCSDTWSVTGCLYAPMLRLRCSELKLRGSNLEAQKLRSLESEVQKHSHSDAQTRTLRTQTQRLGGSEPGIQKLRNWRLRCSDLGYSDSDAQTQMLGAQSQMLGHSDLRCSDAWSLSHSDAQTLRHLVTWMLRHSEPWLGLRASDAQVLRLGHLELRKLRPVQACY
jgi:hypothetical protein